MSCADGNAWARLHRCGTRNSYVLGHKGKFGHDFLEFEFRPDGRLRYSNEDATPTDETGPTDTSDADGETPTTAPPNEDDETSPLA